MADGQSNNLLARVDPTPQLPQVPPEYKRAADLINDLWNDSDIGVALRKKAKEKYPDIRLPDDSIQPAIEPLKKQLDEMAKSLSEEREERKKEREAAEQARAQKSLEERIDEARRKHNLTQEGFDKMIARMKETGNYGDAEAAALWVLSKEPPPPSPGPAWAPKNIDLKGNLDAEKVKLLHSDPVAYQDSEIQDMLRDPDKYVRDTFGASA